MKRIFIILFAYLFILNSCTIEKTILSNNIDYKVKQIEQNDYIYVIDIARNDSTFRIISRKKNIGECSDNIRVGSKYSFNLLQLYPNEFIENKDNEVKINPKDSCFVTVNKKNHYSLYVANNLNGLCVFNNQKDANEIIREFGVYAIICDACKDKKEFILRLFLK